MNTFFDSSAFAKRYIEEPGSDLIEEICLNSTDLALSILCVPEIFSALNRRVRENNIVKKDYLTVKNRLMEEVQDIIIINITPAVLNKAIILLENHDLRTMDALHIACAIEWRPDLFVSSDKKQTEAAKASGLAIRFV